MIVKVYIQLKKLSRCLNMAVQKPFLSRIWKEIFPAIYKLIRISFKIASKPQEKRLFQTALLGLVHIRKLHVCLDSAS